LLRSEQGKEYVFDHVIVATHSDQALALLANPTPIEQEILSSIPYQTNHTILHTDSRLMPDRRKVWASWNYQLPETSQGSVVITYWMNALQSIHSDIPFCVSLNQKERIDPNTILYAIDYEHPVYSLSSVRAQRQHNRISGTDRIHYCGAYWGNGFHEDGVNSALAVCRYFGKGLD
jgi:predicted NAD/FAD-binding protein